MNKKSLILIVCSMCFGAFIFGAVSASFLKAQDDSAVPVPTFTPPTFSFQKNLKIGDNNQDVRQLQLLLNNDADTLVSTIGTGSKGQESTYFGQLTANAVMRFQQKYRKDILDPSGISAPTGFIGLLTRNKLNQLIPVTATTTTGSVSNKVSGALPLAKESLPRLYTITPQQIKAGDPITLIGAGFEITNTLHIGSETFSSVSPQDGNNIYFNKTGGLQNGTYDMWVENVNGNSKVSGQNISLIVTDNPQSSSVISSVTPSSVIGSATVTVNGSGFTGTGNDVVSGFGTIKNLSSNGTQISFLPIDMFSPEVLKKIPSDYTVKIDFYVINVNGVSNTFGSLNFKK